MEVHNSQVIKCSCNYILPHSSQRARELRAEIDMLLKKSDAYSHEGDYDKALDALEEALRCISLLSRMEVVSIDFRVLHNNRAYYLLKKGLATLGLEEIEKSIQEYPTYALAYHTRAEILEDLGWYEQALQSIDKSIALAPSEEKELYRAELLKNKKK